MKELRQTAHDRLEQLLDTLQHFVNLILSTDSLSKRTTLPNSAGPRPSSHKTAKLLCAEFFCLPEDVRLIKAVASTSSNEPNKLDCKRTQWGRAWRRKPFGRTFDEQMVVC